MEISQIHLALKGDEILLGGRTEAMLEGKSEEKVITKGSRREINNTRGGGNKVRTSIWVVIRKLSLSQGDLY